MTEVPVWWFDGSDIDAVAFLDRRQPHARVARVERRRAREPARALRRATRSTARLRQKTTST